MCTFCAILCNSQSYIFPLLSCLLLDNRYTYKFYFLFVFLFFFVSSEWDAYVDFFEAMMKFENECMGKNVKLVLALPKKWQQYTLTGTTKDITKWNLLNLSCSSAIIFPLHFPIRSVKNFTFASKKPTQASRSLEIA